MSEHYKPHWSKAYVAQRKKLKALVKRAYGIELNGWDDQLENLRNAGALGSDTNEPT